MLLYKGCSNIQKCHDIVSLQGWSQVMNTKQMCWQLMSWERLGMSNNSQPKQQVCSGYYSLDGILGLFLRQFVIFISSTSQNVKKIVGTKWKKLTFFFYSWIVWYLGEMKFKKQIHQAFLAQSSEFIILICVFYICILC